MAAPLFYIAVAVWGVAAVWVSVTDWREGRIPKVVVWSAALVTAVILLVVSLLIDNPGRFGLAVLGGAAVCAFLMIFYFLRPGVIGFGDVRLVALNGLLGGWWGLEWAWWSLIAGVFAMLPVALVKALATAWAVKRRGSVVEDEVASSSEEVVSHRAQRISIARRGDVAEVVEDEVVSPAEELEVEVSIREGSSGKQVIRQSESEIQYVEESLEDGASGKRALQQAWRTTLRAGPWLCAGTVAVVVYRWVEVGVL